MKQMAWVNLLTQERLYSDAAVKDIGRSHFHKDYDRIVFSGAFRKLGGKTQVHPLAKYDHIHNRLIHSIEVASVGRSLGIRVAEALRQVLPQQIQPDDIGVIVQSACLAHDIGNPPFGHAGEYAIQDWFKLPENAKYLENLTDVEQLDFQMFEGNAQGLRILTQIEYHLLEGGLRLTYPTIGASLKYPWTSNVASSKGKFSCFQSTKPILDELASKLGLPEKGQNQYARHPLSYLMEAADDICYALIDLEDAVSLNILAFEEVRSVFMSMLGAELKEGEATIAQSPARHLSRLRSKVIGYSVECVENAFIAHLEAILLGEFKGDLISVCPPALVDGIRAAKKLAVDKIFTDVQKTETEIGAYSVLSILLNTFIDAGFEFNRAKKVDALSYRNRRVFTLMGGEAPASDMTQYEVYQRMLDFIAGMTDNYASYLAKQISSPG